MIILALIRSYNIMILLPHRKNAGLIWFYNNGYNNGFIIILDIQVINMSIYRCLGCLLILYHFTSNVNQKYQNGFIVTEV